MQFEHWTAQLQFIVFLPRFVSCYESERGMKTMMKCAWVLLFSALAAASPARAQQKTGPGITGDDSLTWHGITLYGVIDIGVQFDTHSAPFTPYRPSASGNIVRQNGQQSVIGLTPSNMGQSRVGLQGTEVLNEDWAAVFQIETFFNPQSGEIADSLKSLTVNNGRSLTAQTVGVDGSSGRQNMRSAHFDSRCRHQRLVCAQPSFAHRQLSVSLSWRCSAWRDAFGGRRTH